jgi:coenzyme F420 hydrogenase subunit beta
VALIDPAPESITYLEFRADYHVELRYADGRVRTIPFCSYHLSATAA